MAYALLTDECKKMHGKPTVLRSPPPPFTVVVLLLSEGL